MESSSCPARERDRHTHRQRETATCVRGDHIFTWTCRDLLAACSASTAPTRVDLAQKERPQFGVANSLRTSQLNRSSLSPKSAPAVSSHLLLAMARMH